MPTADRSSSRDKVRAHRTRLRNAGLRPVQIWVPDLRSKSFARAAHRQSLAVGKSPMPSGIRNSSTRFLPGIQNETWRDLDRRGWWGLCGQATPRGYRPGRPIRRERFDCRAPLDD